MTKVWAVIKKLLIGMAVGVGVDILFIASFFIIPLIPFIPASFNPNIIIEVLVGIFILAAIYFLARKKFSALLYIGIVIGIIVFLFLLNAFAVANGMDF